MSSQFKMRFSGLLVLLATHWGWADSSPAYTLNESAVSISGGGSSTSSAYSAVSALDAMAGTSTGTTLTVRQGYVGQLAYATHLTVNANPANVSEGATRQLGASAGLDDGSVTALGITEPGWSASGWPLITVSSSGLVTAGIVYQDTTGMVCAVWCGLSNLFLLPVVDTDPDNFGSYAGDVIPDSWQVAYFGTNNSDAAAIADSDKDGQNNYCEYVEGTSPTSSVSFFTLSISRSTGAVSRAQVIFFPRFPDRAYVVLAQTNLMTNSWAELPGTITDNGTQRTVTDTNINVLVKFYKVQITK